MSERQVWKLVVALGSATLAYLAFRRPEARRRSGRRAHAPPTLPTASASESRRDTDLIEGVHHRLGIIRGCCEIARQKNESGTALADRMDAAIETVGEVSFLVRSLGSRRRAR